MDEKKNSSDSELECMDMFSNKVMGTEYEISGERQAAHYLKSEDEDGGVTRFGFLGRDTYHHTYEPADGVPATSTTAQWYEPVCFFQMFQCTFTPCSRNIHLNLFTSFFIHRHNGTSHSSASSSSPGDQVMGLQQNNQMAACTGMFSSPPTPNHQATTASLTPSKSASLNSNDDAKLLSESSDSSTLPFSSSDSDSNSDVDSLGNNRSENQAVLHNGDADDASKAIKLFAEFQHRMGKIEQKRIRRSKASMRTKSMQKKKVVTGDVTDAKLKRRERYRAHSATEIERALANKKKRAEARSPAEAEACRIKRNAQEKSIRDQKKRHVLHNAVYPCDKLPTDRASMDWCTLFGKKTKNVTYLPPRLTHCGEDITIIREPLGKGAQGIYQSLSDTSLQKVINSLIRLLPSDGRGRRCNSIDLGSGLGHPSLHFAMYYFCLGGLHAGIELSEGLHNTSQFNLRSVTDKGMVSLKEGCLDPVYIHEHGELNIVYPPCIALVCANIVSILFTPMISFVKDILPHTLFPFQLDLQDLGMFDFAYGFDSVNTPQTKFHLAEIWNKKESRNCKFFITNSNESEMKEYRFEDIILKDQVTVSFRSVNESRTTYIYRRASIPSKPKMKFEFENPVQSAPDPFKDVWDRFNKGRLDKRTGKLKAGYRYNMEIVEMNMSADVLGNSIGPRTRRSSKEHTAEQL